MKRTREIRAFELAEAGLITLAIAIGGFTMWFVAHSKQVANDAYNAATYTTPTSTSKSTANIVDDPQNGSVDLVAFLRSDDTGCWRAPSQGTGWYRIVKEVNDNQADMEYGCSQTYSQGNGSPVHILAHKVSGKWQLISPTNQWSYNIPSCTMLQENDILAVLEPACWTKQSSSGTMVVANQNSQYAHSYSTCVVSRGSRVAKDPVTLCTTKDGVVFTR